ncbi:MAG TPA: arsenic-transporting ATPase, partial [Pseudohongiella sp.]|nr:arsenic-transporting ATPase [Pseudohongiella sp.]
DALADADKTGFVIVLAAERLPVLETIELHAQLVRSGVDVAGLVVNKRLPDGLQGFLAERKSQEDIHLATLNDSLGQVTRQDLQLAPADVLGVDALRAFASQF